jgi:hypothetical protein
MQVVVITLMKRAQTYIALLVTTIVTCAAYNRLAAQDLDPRAYARIPVGATSVSAGFSFSQGGVVLDPSVPLQDLKASVYVPSFALVHSFRFFGLTSQALVALPFSWANGSATINGVRESTSRSGLADMRLRYSVLFTGAPAATAVEMANAPRKTVLGASINIIAPTGQFFPDKLINIGTNRWSFRPELAISQPMGKRWLIDVYGGVWFFTDNQSFYPGNSLRTQKPMTAIQAHLSYNISLRAWVALDATFYAGGQSSVNGGVKDDRQENSRVGMTIVVPVKKFNSIKFAISRGAVVRIGQNFTTASIAWQRSWLAKPKQKK